LEDAGSGPRNGGRDKRMGLLQRNAAIVVFSLLLLAVAQVHACSWAVGYFYQVTALKGRIVGTNFHGLPRWLRQSFARKHAKLTLYEYQSYSRRSDKRLVSTVETDGDGSFDFGPLKTGHYTLIAEEDWYEEWFDVEVKDLPKLTESVTVDVSPVLPDCTGGHEFIISTK
jgi:hypothetical protein